MHTLSLVLLVLVFLVSCSPAVPYNQMPGYDLYGSANSNEMTADAAYRLAQMQRQALTATAEAPIIRITETAAGLAVQGTQAAGTSTAAVQTQIGAMSATAIWWTPTPHLASTATVAALNAQNTMIANNLERDRLALERQQDNNQFNRLAGPLLLISALLFLIMFGFVQVRRLSHMPASVDGRGNVLPMINVVDGIATDIDRNPNFQALLKSGLITRLLESKLGLQPLLPAVTASRQDATTERDQMVDLATRGLPGATDNKEQKRLAGQEMMKQVSASNLDSRFKLVDGSVPEGAINGDIIQVLDQDWKEADKK